MYRKVSIEEIVNDLLLNRGNGAQIERYLVFKAEVIDHILSLGAVKQKEIILQCFNQNEPLCKYIHQKRFQTEIQLSKGLTQKLFHALKKLDLSLEEIDGLYSTDTNNMEEFKQQARTKATNQMTIEELKTYLKNYTLSQKDKVVILIHYWYANPDKGNETLSMHKEKDINLRFSSPEIDETIDKLAKQFRQANQTLNEKKDEIFQLLYSISKQKLSIIANTEESLQRIKIFAMTSPKTIFFLLQNNLIDSDYSGIVPIKRKIVEQIFQLSETDQENILWQCFTENNHWKRYFFTRQGLDPVSVLRGEAHNLFSQLKMIIEKNITKTKSFYNFKITQVKDNIIKLTEIKNKLENFLSSLEDAKSVVKKLLDAIDENLKLNQIVQFCLENDKNVTTSSISNFFNFISGSGDRNRLKKIKLNSIFPNHINFFKKKLFNLDIDKKLLNINIDFNVPLIKSFMVEGIIRLTVAEIFLALKNKVIDSEHIKIFSHLKKEIIDHILNITDPEEHKKAILDCFHSSNSLYKLIHEETGPFSINLTRGDSQTHRLFQALKTLDLSEKEIDELHSSDNKNIEKFKKQTKDKLGKSKNTNLYQLYSRKNVTDSDIEKKHGNLIDRIFEL